MNKPDSGDEVFIITHGEFEDMIRNKGYSVEGDEHHHSDYVVSSDDIRELMEKCRWRKV